MEVVPNIFSKNNCQYNLTLKLRHNGRWRSPSNPGRNGHSLPAAPMALLESDQLHGPDMKPIMVSQCESPVQTRLQGLLNRRLGTHYGMQWKYFRLHKTYYGLMRQAQELAARGTRRSRPTASETVGSRNRMRLSCVCLCVHMYVDVSVQDVMGRSYIQGYWTDWMFKPSYWKDRLPVCVQAERGHLDQQLGWSCSLRSLYIQLQQLGRVGDPEATTRGVACLCPSKREIHMLHMYRFPINGPSLRSLREGNRVIPTVLFVFVMSFLLVLLCVANHIYICTVYVCLCMCLLEIYAQLHPWFKLGPWSCGSLAPIRVLDLAVS